MSSLPELEACLSILPSALPAPGSTINTTIFGVVFMLAAAAGIVHYASPPHLTRVLVGPWAITSFFSAGGSWAHPVIFLSELEACLSILPSALPAPGSTINTTIFGVVFMLVVAAGIVHYASPPRLTRVLVTAISNVEKTYLDALETGLLSASDIDTAEMLSTLQLNVSKIREASLRNSLSHSGTLREFFGGRTFTLLRCIHEVRVLEIHIEILKEAQLREDSLHPFANCTRAVSLRRRRLPPSYNL
ncbi:hypothetical protein B0H13DRAFT_2322346 [Mycena leptocephala]|nr:hypothetical protein B0H13DRAFT_2322346 [Mycena leptocephala]